MNAKPARIRYLIRQRGVYTFKRDVPGNVRPWVPGMPTQWWQTLDTRDETTAIERLAPIARAHQTMIDSIRAAVARKTPAERMREVVANLGADLADTIADALSDTPRRAAADRTLREVAALLGPTLADSIRSAMESYGLPQMVRASAHLAEARAADA